MELEEATLLLKLKSGDRSAFEVVFKTYYQRLCTYSYSFVKDLDEAEEIVQQIFYQLWERRESIGINLSIKSYLYKSVHNTCLNHIKHLKVKQQYQETTMASEKSYTGTFHLVMKKELEQQITKAIKALPEQCRLIFKLSRFENLKYAEIASQLDISEKTVENQMGKALKNLRERLKEYLVIVISLLLIR